MYLYDCYFVSLTCNKTLPDISFRTGQFLLHLRAAVDQVVGYLIETQGLHATPPDVDEFCDELVMYVSKLLRTQDEEQKVSRLWEGVDERY